MKGVVSGSERAARAAVVARLLKSRKMDTITSPIRWLALLGLD